jgi:hypothetical protein
MQFYVRRIAKIRGGTINPVAFVPNRPKPSVVFEVARRKYYHLDFNTDKVPGGYIKRFMVGFGWHDEVLTALTAWNPRMEGAVQEFLEEETEEIYAVVSKEQKRRAKKAKEMLQSSSA